MEDPTVHDPIEDLLAEVITLPDDEQPMALDALCAAHPAEARALRERFAAFVRLQQIGPRPTSLVTGTRFGEFELQRELGRGGMGVVYLARQERAGQERLVALKIVRDRGLLSKSAHERFRREAAAAFRLDDAGLCPVFDVGEVDGVPWLAMRYVPGRTLADHIAHARRVGALVLPAGAAHGDTSSTDADHRTTSTAGERFHAVLTLGESLARSLHVAHEAGFVHRDVKPSNVMVTPDGQPVLLDFGLVREESGDHTLTATGETLGTPAYMSPEQIEGSGRVGRASDVYSLAATIFEAITLRPPFTGRTREELFRAILQNDAADVRDLVPGVSRDLHVVLSTALARNPEQRYTTALEFAQELARVRRSEPILARPPSVLRRLSLWSARNRLAAGLLAALALALVAVVLVAIEARSQGDRATVSLRSARQVVAELIRVQQNELDGVPLLEQTRRDLQSRALRFLQQLLEDNRGIPELRLENAEAMVLAAYLELSLGHAETAERLHQDARELLAVTTAGDRAVRGRWHMFAGDLEDRRGDSRGAATEFETAAAHLLAGPRSSDDTLAAMRALRRAAAMLERRNDRDAAFAAIDRAAALQARFGEARDASIDLAVAATLRQRAQLRRESDQAEGADADCRAADELLRAVLRDRPQDGRVMAELARNLMVHTKVHRLLGRSTERRATLAEARDLWQELSQAFPSMPAYKYNLAYAATARAPILDVDGRRNDAIAEFDLARSALVELVKQHPEVVSYRFMLANTFIKLGHYHREDLDAAMSCYRKGLEQAMQLAESRPEDSEFRYIAAQAALGVAGVETMRESSEAPRTLAFAREQARKVFELRPDDQRPRVLYAAALMNEGTHHAALGNFEFALKQLEQATEFALAYATAAPEDIIRGSDLLRFGVEACVLREAAEPDTAADRWSQFAADWRSLPAASRERLLRFGAAERFFCMLARAEDAGPARAGDAAAAGRLANLPARLSACIELLPSTPALRAELLVCFADLRAHAAAAGKAVEVAKWEDEFGQAIADWPATSAPTPIERARLRRVREELVRANSRLAADPRLAALVDG